MSDLAQEIRRIAKGDKLKGPLGGTLERDPIPGTFIPFSNTPLSQITANGAEGEDPVDINSNESNGDSQTGSDQPMNGDDINTLNRGSVTTGQKPNTHDIGDVIDGAAGVPNSPNEQDNSGSNTQPESPTSGVLSGLTGATDCNTGQCINFHLDGNFPAPDGWPDADSPPVQEGYEAGYYWKTQAMGSSVGIGQTPLLALYDRTTDIRAGLSQEYFGEDTVKFTCDNAPATCISYGGGGLSGAEVYRLSCEGETDPEIVAVCEADPPLEEAWPEDGCYDLALQDGALVTNDYDSEAPSDAGGSKVNVCFGDGRTGSVEITANGGVIVYETSGGNPTGTAHVYGADGTYQAGMDATDANMDPYRPK